MIHWFYVQTYSNKSLLIAKLLILYLNILFLSDTKKNELFRKSALSKKNLHSGFFAWKFVTILTASVKSKKKLFCAYQDGKIKINLLSFLTGLIHKDLVYLPRCLYQDFYVKRWTERHLFRILTSNKRSKKKIYYLLIGGRLRGSSEVIRPTN